MEGAMFNEVMEVLKRPFVYETFVDLLMCYVPIWVAVIIGLVIGWSWRPRWTGLVFLGLRPNKFRGFVWSIPPGFGARRLWLAFTALSAFPVCRSIWFYFRGNGKQQLGSGGGGAASVNTDDNRTITESGSGQVIELAESNIAGPGWRIREKPQEIVNEKDVEHLLHLLEGKDGEATWQRMFERSTPNMACQAWRQEPETGPVVYKSRTVYEDATPELVRDFFWDDEFRPKWDPMLSYFKILEECTQTGSMIVHWIKKFPFFCSDREYIIGRRIWEDGKAYYCVTKGVPYPSLPKRDKPRRVDLYFSSWVIRAVESRKGDGQMSACEVILVHYEDMGIPKDVAKLGVRHGMWGTVKKIHSGMRAYQNARKPGAALSRCALLAGVTTKISFEETADSADHVSEGERGQIMVVERNRKDNGIDWKWVVIGGTVALACGLHTGVIGRAILIGAGRRIARN